MEEYKRKIKNLELQHEELIKNIKGNPEYKVVSPVCPGVDCGWNISLEEMVEHFKCCKHVVYEEFQCQLNKEVNIFVANYRSVVYKLEDSRDWFVIQGGVHILNSTPPPFFKKSLFFGQVFRDLFVLLGS